MPVYTADALIVRTYKLGEVDRVVVFLTSDRGKKRGVAKGARRARSRFSGGLEPLTRAVVAYFERENRDLVQLNYVDPRRSPLAARDPAALDYVGYFAELIDAWAAESNPNGRLYRLGASIVEALAVGAPVGRLARYFEYWLLRLEGVYPSIAACHRCTVDLRQSGARLGPHDVGFLCPRCGRASSGVDVSPEALEFLRSAAETPPQRVGEIRLSQNAARELQVAHQLLLAAHLDKELKSVRVLREIGA